jgi:hypothetical protein
VVCARPIEVGAFNAPSTPGPIHIWLVEARGVVEAGCVPHGRGRRVDKVGHRSCATAFLAARSTL